MLFSRYPKKLEQYLIYSSKETTHSKIFKNLRTQISAKNSIFFRLAASDIGYWLAQWFKESIDVPKNESEYIGLVKKDQKILFELESNQPTNVWRKENGHWQNEPFLGYQLISVYSLVEFQKKKEAIANALDLHWKNVSHDQSKIHGDLTHFNILLSQGGGYEFIDQKSNEHSRIYDFFYFHSYLKQSVFRNSELKTKEKEGIEGILDDVLRKVCLNARKEELIEELEHMNIPKYHGLHDIKESIVNFKKVLEL